MSTLSSLGQIVRGRSADLDLNQLVTQPTSELLGVSRAAAQALEAVGIRTVFDLGTSHLFTAARAAADAGRFGSASARFGLPPADILAPNAQFSSLSEIPGLPISRLRGLTQAQADALTAALDVETIRDLANWPPHAAARRLVNETSGSTVDPSETQAEDLRPRFGEFPTERVYYTTLVMLHMDNAGQLADLNGPVSLDEIADDSPLFNRVAVGSLLTFSQSWFAQGVTLGHMLHSLALAPGEATRIAVIDWSRRTSATATESISESERLDSASSHARALSEVQRAVANDFQAGGSRSSSSSTSESGSVAASASTGFLTSLFASGEMSGTYQSASTNASAESSGWSVGNRSVMGSLQQNVNDRTEQHSASVRNRRASAVREVSQSEHESVSTRIVANYNHMHALTIQYYEVVQIYRAVARLERADRTLFVPLQMIDFSRPNAMNTVIRFRAALIRAALNPQIRSLLFDDTTAVAIKPVVPVRAPSIRIELGPLLRIPLPVSPIGPFAPNVAVGGGVANVAPVIGAINLTAAGVTAAPVSAVAAAPAATNSTVNLAGASSPVLRVWDENILAAASRVLDRTLLRPLSDALHVPDDTELLAITFNNLNVNRARLDREGSAAGNQPTFSVPTDSGRLDLERPIRFLDLDAIALGKSDDAAKTGTIILHCSYMGRRFSLPPIPVEMTAGTAMQIVVDFESDQAKRREELLRHLQDHREHYSQAIFRSLDAATLTLLLSRFRWNGRPLIEQVEPRPLMVAGNYLVLRAPVENDEESGVRVSGDPATWQELLESRGLTLGDQPDQRLIPIPTGGVFAEAVLGRSNAAEKLDLTRFWNWQDSPIPFAPPEISPVGTGSRGETEDLKPGQLGPPVLNILNPTSLPDPAGLGAAFNALSSINFRDMSGLAGTQALVQAAMKESMAGTTEAGKLASENMKTAAQKSVAMGQIAADIAKAAIAAYSGNPAAAGGGGNNAGISGRGAEVNHARDMDERGVPVPGAADQPSSNGASPASSGGMSASSTTNPPSNNGSPAPTNGTPPAAPRRTTPARRRSHEGRAADPTGRAVETFQDSQVTEMPPMIITAGYPKFDVSIETLVQEPGDFSLSAPLTNTVTIEGYAFNGILQALRFDGTPGPRYRFTAIGRARMTGFETAIGGGGTVRVPGTQRLEPPTPRSLPEDLNDTNVTLTVQENSGGTRIRLFLSEFGGEATWDSSDSGLTSGMIVNARITRVEELF